MKKEIIQSSGPQSQPNGLRALIFPCASDAPCTTFIRFFLQLGFQQILMIDPRRNPSLTDVEDWSQARRRRRHAPS